MKNNTEALGKDKIPKLLWKLSLPAGIGMVVMALYNLVDTIFVGQGVGLSGIGALAIIFPIQTIIAAVALTIGIGGSSIISRSLGAGNPDKANLTFANMISLIVISGLLMIAVLYLFSEEILILFGAKGELLRYGKEYFNIVLWGSPFLGFAMMSNNMIRAEGNAKTAMYTMLVSALINLILDPILIFGMDWGMSGAAWATIIAQISAAFFVVYYYRSGKSSLKFIRANLKLDASIVKETMAIGSSSFARQFSTSIMAVVLNNSLLQYGGEAAIAVFGVINRVRMMTFMPIFGVAQGFLPVAGFNYGAENFGRVKEAIRISVMSSTGIATIGFAVLMIFPGPILSAFSSDPMLANEGVNAMRYIIAGLPLIGIQVISASLFHAMGKALPGFVLSLTRQFFLLIPLVIILPKYFGLVGIWYAFPIADGLSLLMTLALVMPQRKNLKTVHKQQPVEDIITSDIDLIS
ncbi:MAG: MATE family efflux transporter [Chlorobi bacterium]|nr:MATE family efflux transporter [Chlorobiota bacterium]